MNPTTISAGSYRRWLLGTCFAFVLGCGASGLLTAPLVRNIAEPYRWLALGALLGCFVGVAQTRFLPLNQAIRRRLIWEALSTVVGGIGGISFYILTPLIEHTIRNDWFLDTLRGVGVGSVNGAGCGLLLGILQWLLLRPWDQPVGRAILANMLGWLIGWALLGGLMGFAIRGMD
jgi:hypothetical protein